MAQDRAGRGAHLVVQDLRKVFMHGGRRLEILRGIRMEVRPGEMVAIVGASGVGKSTLLHVLGTLDAPTSGSMRFDGQELTRMPPARLADFRNREIGFVFQFHHLLPEFTALENVMMPALIQRMPRTEAEARSRAMLGRVGLDERLTHRVRRGPVQNQSERTIGIVLAYQHDGAMKKRAVQFAAIEQQLAFQRWHSFFHGVNYIRVTPSQDNTRPLFRLSESGAIGRATETVTCSPKREINRDAGALAFSRLKVNNTPRTYYLKCAPEPPPWESGVEESNPRFAGLSAKPAESRRSGGRATPFNSRLDRSGLLIKSVGHVR